jgi:hypothetical protein
VYYRNVLRKKLAFICLPQSQNNGKPCFDYVILCSLARVWNPASTIYIIVLTIYCISSSPTCSSHCAAGGILMVRSEYKIGVQAERPSVLTCGHINLLLNCGSHIIVISSNFTSSASTGKTISCLFQLGCQFARSTVSLATLRRLLAFPWMSKLPGWPPREPSYLRGFKPGGPHGSLWLSSATAHSVQPPHHTSGLDPGGPLWLSFSFPLEFPLSFH